MSGTARLRDRHGVLHVTALSGGGDSTCMALLMRERGFAEQVYVCTPTGRELPEMWAHWQRLGVMLGRTLMPIMPAASGGLHGIIRQQKCLPNGRRRFCTRIAKIEPYRAWLAERATEGPVVSYVGLRADEPGRAGGAYDDIPGVSMRFPLREWGMDEAAVDGWLEQRGVVIPERTDCGECYDQQLGEWWRYWHDHPAMYAESEALEHEIGGTFRTPRIVDGNPVFGERGGIRYIMSGRDTWPCSLTDMRRVFEAGFVPDRRYDPRQRDLLRSGACRACSL